MLACSIIHACNYVFPVFFFWQFAEIHSTSRHGPVRLNVSAMVQCFSLTTNQRTILFSLTFQRSEQGHRQMHRAQRMAIRENHESLIN